ncbi:D-lactate dehydrogenase (cytochrome), partial [Tremellales sp. Uapishka_1]
MSLRRPVFSLRSTLARSTVQKRFATAPPPPPPLVYPPPSGRSFALSLLLVFGSASLGYILHDSLKIPKLPISTHLVDSTLAKELQEKNQPRFGSRDDYLAAIALLKHVIKDADRISTDESDLETHGVSDWSYHEAKMPTVVVWATSTEEVQSIVKIATKYKVPITPFSGGTSLEGHFSSPYGGISLDVSLMDSILRVSEADGDVTVQPGVKWEDLNAYLASKSIPLFFPLDPGPGATIGGMIGTGCSGTNAVRYGTAKAEWFLNATVVLPSGEVIKTRSRARKSAAGFDTTKLFIGAEGTLGIVTEATLRLAPLLPTKCAVVTFDGVEEAVKAATEVVNAGFPVQCVEYLDALTMKAINQGGLAGRQYKQAETLFFKFQGSNEAMAEVSKNVQKVTKKHGGQNFEFSKSQEEAQKLWQGRKAALWSVLALRDGSKVWTTDVCVPISKLPQLVRETREDFEKRGLTACHFGHVGDGNVHSLALFSDEKELAVVREAVHEMVERAIRLDGTCTGEHGVGVGKVEYLETELGAGTIGLMETVKRTLDPLDLFNPGKIYPNIKPIRP